MGVTVKINFNTVILFVFFLSLINIKTKDSNRKKKRSALPCSLCCLNQKSITMNDNAPLKTQKTECKPHLYLKKNLKDNIILLINFLEYATLIIQVENIKTKDKTWSVRNIQ